jgi:hypothetical protein
MFECVLAVLNWDRVELLLGRSMADSDAFDATQCCMFASRYFGFQIIHNDSIGFM